MSAGEYAYGRTRESSAMPICMVVILLLCSCACISKLVAAAVPVGLLIITTVPIDTKVNML